MLQKIHPIRLQAQPNNSKNRLKTKQKVVLSIEYFLEGKTKS